MQSLMITKHTHTDDNHVHIIHTLQLVVEQRYSLLVTQASITAAHNTTQTSHHNLSTPHYVQHHTYIHTAIR